jgi:hypothetical protein
MIGAWNDIEVVKSSTYTTDGSTLIDNVELELFASQFNGTLKCTPKPLPINYILKWRVELF